MANSERAGKITYVNSQVAEPAPAPTLERAYKGEAPELGGPHASKDRGNAPAVQQLS